MVLLGVLFQSCSSYNFEISSTVVTIYTESQGILFREFSLQRLKEVLNSNDRDLFKGQGTTEFLHYREFLQSDTINQYQYQGLIYRWAKWAIAQGGKFLGAANFHSTCRNK